jgi:hypothetical protein
LIEHREDSLAVQIRDSGKSPGSEVCSP